MLPSLESLRHVHVIGVCGTLMGAFAAFLRRRGVKVTGSDQNVYPPMSDVLRAAGVTLFDTYRPENLTAVGRPDLVVIGNVIPAVNPEARAAIAGGYSYTSLPEAMESLFLERTRNLVVAGTHGKTTTTSLLAHVLASAGRDPAYFIGGIPADLPYAFHVPGVEEGRLFVLEGDEYDTVFWDKGPKFNHYRPDDVILTSIEFDHADIYPDLAAVCRAFDGLIDRIRPGGRLIACLDYETVRTAVARARAVELLSYGSTAGSGARLSVAGLAEGSGGTSFEILEGGRSVASLTMPLAGRHNALNALAVWIECRELGLDSDSVRQAIARFRGVKRRQEERATVRGVTVIDDFAHHPTAVRETLAALRARHPSRRLVAVFEPRSATSRRKIFQKDYAEAFDSADRVLIAAAYDQSKIASADQFSSAQLVEDLRARGRDARLMHSVEAGVRELASESREGDLIAVLSNGGFGGLIPKLVETLEKGH